MKPFFTFNLRLLLVAGMLGWIFLLRAIAADNEVVVISPHSDG